MGTSLFSGIWREIRKKFHQKFDEKNEIRERCKGVHCVDLGESFPTRIYLQKSASIQPRTSPSKFGGKFNSIFTSLLSVYCRVAPVQSAARSKCPRSPFSDYFRFLIQDTTFSAPWVRRASLPRGRSSFRGVRTKDTFFQSAT